MDNIENRLTELSSTLSNFEQTIRRLGSDVSALKVKNSDLEKKATKLQAIVDFCEEDISAVKMNIKKNEVEIEELKKIFSTWKRTLEGKTSNSSGFLRRLTLRTTWNKTSHHNRSKTPKTLSINSWKSISKLRIQMVQSSSKGSTDWVNQPLERRAPLQQGFCDTKTKREQARKLLRGKDFAIFDDILKELYESRKKQLNKFKEARKKGPNAYFSKAHPDKLFVERKFVALDEPLK